MLRFELIPLAARIGWTFPAWFTQGRREAPNASPAPAAASPYATEMNNIFPDSATAMRAILDRHFPCGSILDVNYGLGVFYRQVSRRIVGVDLRPTCSLVADNRCLPFHDLSFDVGVLDPPYKRGKGNVMEARYGVAPKTETKVTRSYLEALPELLRVVRTGLIIKCQDGTDGHRFHPRHLLLTTWMREQTGLHPHDIAVSVRPRLGSVLVPGAWHHVPLLPAGV